MQERLKGGGGIRDPNYGSFRFHIHETFFCLRILKEVCVSDTFCAFSLTFHTFRTNPSHNKNRHNLHKLIKFRSCQKGLIICSLISSKGYAYDLSVA